MTTQYDISRYNMINYMKTWEVQDNTVLDIMGSISREVFFPEKLSSLSYADAMVPIGYGQVSLEPKMIGRILQSINLKKSDTVLEIGTGSGYLTSILSALSKQVFTVELIPEILEKADSVFKKLKLDNISSKAGDGLDGWKDKGPFDAIVVTGSLSKVPDHLANMLQDNGRLFLTVGTKPVMRATLFTKVSKKLKEEVLFDTNIPKIINTADQE
jgi:protein-L-isoaspartate(D-aspartate) O-methyltransferase